MLAKNNHQSLMVDFGQKQNTKSAVWELTQGLSENIECNCTKNVVIPQTHKHIQMTCFLVETILVEVTNKGFNLSNKFQWISLNMQVNYDEHNFIATNQGPRSILPTLQKCFFFFLDQILKSDRWKLHDMR